MPALRSVPTLVDQLRAGDVVDVAGANLSGADLEGASLEGRDFRGADLRDANLQGANLLGANLEGALLSGANLSGAELAAANLRDAQLERCTAERAGFGKAKLDGATFFGAKLGDASFVEASAENTDFRAVDARGARFCSATLVRANFSRADLRGGDLEGADVHQAVFVQSDLGRCRLRGLNHFRHASFLSADIRDVDFSGAYLLRRHILDSNYLEEFKRQSRMHRFIYAVWWATSDCDRSMFRWAVLTLAITGLFGAAYTTVDIDFGAAPTPLSPWYFSVVTLTTLGYGDVLPRSTLAQLLVMAQVAMGYFMLGGLLSIFAAKMARRGE